MNATNTNQTPQVWHAYLMFEGAGEFSEHVKQPGQYLCSKDAHAAAIEALKRNPKAFGATAIKAQAEARR